MTGWGGGLGGRGLYSEVQCWGRGSLYGEFQCIVGNGDTGPPCEQNDGQTRLKTLPFRTLVGGGLIFSVSIPGRRAL